MDNNEINEIEVACKKKIGETQINNSITIGGEDEFRVTKVLTVNARPVVEDAVVANSEVKINGYVEYDLLLILENNEIVSNTQKSSFVVNYQAKEISEKTIIDVCAEISEINNMSDEKLNITSVVKFKIYAINTNPVSNCSSDIDGVFVKTKEMNYSSFVDRINYKFQVSFDENKDSRFNKVLFVSNNVCIKDVVPANDYFVVNGEVFSTIVFQNEDGLIKSIVKELDFSEEIEFKGVNKDSIILAKVYAREAEIVENMENKTFSFTIPLEVNAEVFERRCCNTVVDAYSLNNEVKLTTTSFDDNMFYPTKQLNASISTTASIDENLEQIDKVLAVIPSNVSIINQIVKEGSFLVEGIVNVNIIYYSVDNEGADVLNSFDIDVPYSLKFDIPELKENDQVICNLVVRDITVKNKFGKELEISIDFIVNYSNVSNSTNAMVSKVEVGDEKEKEDFALEICFANNENSLWDIAKKMNISVEDLIKQNGELSVPIQDGEKIVAYKQRNINFDWVLCKKNNILAQNLI